jgi:hypothetical protein
MIEENKKHETVRRKKNYVMIHDCQKSKILSDFNDFDI